MGPGNFAVVLVGLRVASETLWPSTLPAYSGLAGTLFVPRGRISSPAELFIYSEDPDKVWYALLGCAKFWLGLGALSQVETEYMEFL